ncbi:ABC transporter ATP-binding protein [Roseibium limicola]|uniref:ABC transporter ATP-binding protein n=1 Tax=Roseibium limicola TaxID=2816037 RepID=A0A939J8E0_9HYPH|nr:ABC transporter ATP-binding protein [Roseibium limicola]MBO0344258.1 ABC transporter ATP-binding protein [Roseibium limicola]
MGVLLAIDDVNLSFGGVHALSGVSLDVEKGRVTSIIGPNGAGKTSLFNVISGFYTPQSGSIRFEKQELSDQAPYQRSPVGISRTFQNIALFSGLTVLENIKLGAHCQLSSGLLSSALWWGKAQREEAALSRRIDEEIIDLLDLREIRDRPIAGLPYGLQKRVELARALVGRPKLLMLDEPVAGMTSSEKQEMAGYIRRCVDEWSTTVLLIDHDMTMVMGLSDHVVVVNFGKVIASGAPAQMQEDPAVIAAYLGEN